MPMQIRPEERDPETLFLMLSNATDKDKTAANLWAALAALSGILVETERRIQRLNDRCNNIGMVIDRNGKTTFEKFEAIEKRIIDMGFPT